jgi:hypothetical protein
MFNMLCKSILCDAWAWLMIQLPLFRRGFRFYAYRFALQDRQFYLLQLDHLLPAQPQERAW